MKLACTIRLNPHDTPPATTTTPGADGGPPYEVQSGKSSYSIAPIHHFIMFIERRTGKLRIRPSRAPEPVTYREVHELDTDPGGNANISQIEGRYSNAV